jgi:outer membrane lipoprotein LolB
MRSSAPPERGTSPRLRALLSCSAVLFIAAVAGCRTAPPPQPAAESWQVRRPQLQARAHFVLSGRVAVATGNEGFNANLRWVQDGPRSQVTLEGPLGVGGAQISASGDELHLITSRGEEMQSDAAHAALAQRLGFDPPISSLRYWVLGVPDPAQPATEALDPTQQRLSQLTQSGWHVNYNAYTSASGEPLPARLTLERDAVRVRLLVDNWQP